MSVIKGKTSIDSELHEKDNEWLGVVENCASWVATGMKIHRFPALLKDKINQELELYFKSGNCSPTRTDAGTVNSFNPTLLEPKTLKWRVNALSSPFNGYSPLELDRLERAHEDGVVIQYCQEILKDLLLSFKKIAEKNVQFYFHCHDDLQFILDENLDEFDVIDTSSLADQVGLANLIPACFRRLKHRNSSILLTESFDWGKVSPTVMDYVEKSLCVPLRMIPTIYGLRLRNHVELGGEKISNSCSSNDWSLVSLCWSPAPQLENVPLGPSADIEQCLKLLEKKCYINETDSTNIYKEGECGFHRYTPLTLHLVMARLTELSGGNRTPFYNLNSAPQFASIRQFLQACADGRSVKSLTQTLFYSPEVASFFNRQSLTFRSPPLRVALVPNRFLATRFEKISGAESANNVIHWAAEKAGVHYIDVFDLVFVRDDDDGSIVFIHIGYLLPEKLNLSRTHSLVVIDLYTGLPRVMTSAVVNLSEGICDDPNPFLKWPFRPSEPKRRGSYLKGVNCQESEKDYLVTVKLVSTKRPHGI